MNRTLIPSLVAAALAVFLPSCNSSSDPDTTTEEVLYDIVTYKASSNNGNSFTAQKDDLSSEVTLTTSQVMDTTYVKVGQRMLIAYTLPSGAAAYTNSSITLKGYSPIVNDTIHTGTYAGDDSYQTLLAAWVTGKYLNIHSTVTVAQTAKEYYLLLDEKTADSSCPTVRLVFKPDFDVDKVTPQSMYASFDISSLRNKEGVTGFNLVWKPYGSTGSGSETFTFNDKITIAPTPAE
jgi:hypothetical protein